MPFSLPVSVAHSLIISVVISKPRLLVRPSRKPTGPRIHLHTIPCLTCSDPQDQALFLCLLRPVAVVILHLGIFFPLLVLVCLDGLVRLI